MRRASSLGEKLAVVCYSVLHSFVRSIIIMLLLKIKCVPVPQARQVSCPSTRSHVRLFRKQRLCTTYATSRITDVLVTDFDGVLLDSEPEVAVHAVSCVLITSIETLFDCTPTHYSSLHRGFTQQPQFGRMCWGTNTLRGTRWKKSCKTFEIAAPSLSTALKLSSWYMHHLMCARMDSVHSLHAPVLV